MDKEAGKIRPIDVYSGELKDISEVLATINSDAIKVQKILRSISKKIDEGASIGKEDLEILTRSSLRLESAKGILANLLGSQ